MTFHHVFSYSYSVCILYLVCILYAAAVCSLHFILIVSEMSVCSALQSYIGNRARLQNYDQQMFWNQHSKSFLESLVSEHFLRKMPLLPVGKKTCQASNANLRAYTKFAVDANEIKTIIKLTPSSSKTTTRSNFDRKR